MKGNGEYLKQDCSDGKASQKISEQTLVMNYLLIKKCKYWLAERLKAYLYVKLL